VKCSLIRALAAALQVTTPFMKKYQSVDPEGAKLLVDLAKKTLSKMKAEVTQP